MGGGSSCTPCGALSSVSSSHPQDASRSSPVMTIESVSRHCQMAPSPPVGGGGEIPPVENPCSRGQRELWKGLQQHPGPESRNMHGVGLLLSLPLPFPLLDELLVSMQHHRRKRTCCVSPQKLNLETISSSDESVHYLYDSRPLNSF